jgi:hypothetical protein
MESVLHLKNHAGMPDPVLYICYHTVFIYWFFFGFFTIRIHNTVGEDVVNKRW